MFVFVPTSSTLFFMLFRDGRQLFSVKTAEGKTELLQRFTTKNHSRQVTGSDALAAAVGGQYYIVAGFLQFVSETWFFFVLVYDVSIFPPNRKR